MPRRRRVSSLAEKSSSGIPYYATREVEELRNTRVGQIWAIDPPRFEDAGTVRGPMADGHTVSGDEPIPCFEGGTWGLHERLGSRRGWRWWVQ